MDPTTQLARILPAVSEVVEGIRPEQLDDPTPCDRFSVHDVLDHMVVLGGRFAHAFRGEEAPEITTPAVNGSVPVEAFRSAMGELLDAVRSPGALERSVSAPFGEVPGETFARFVAFDGLVHGWDLARATGQDYAPDPEAVAAIDEFARQALTPDMRDGDTFAAEATPPAGADTLERLIAFSGRRV
jgi:uncharacterized protein (TIGR03086 family)